MHDTHSENSLVICCTRAGRNGQTKWVARLGDRVVATEEFKHTWTKKRGEFAHEVANDPEVQAARITYGEVLKLVNAKACKVESDGGAPSETRAEDSVEPVAEADVAAPAALMKDPWPDPMDQRAYHGLAGEFVRTIEPHSESDPAAILVQLLVAFGNMIGRSAHYWVEAARHYPNLFVVLVGDTSKARKGTSWSHVHRIVSAAEDKWSREQIMTGLSSGEGLIYHVRDAVVKKQPVREKGTGKVTEYQHVIDDEGVSDKRLLIYEPEFASVLKRIERDGNCLSAILRQAWENGNLRTLTKNSPTKATGAHVSLVGHITKEELQRYLTTTEAANGFANRFLWLCCRRSKCLPDGGSPDPAELAPFVQRLADAMSFASNIGRIGRDEEAKVIWHAVYPDLSAGKPGLLGAITSRAEAYVMRLATAYALLDRSAQIRAEHLKAALAVWEYAEASARCIFGRSTGNPLADEILAALQKSPAGMTRTDIRDLFGRHSSADRIGKALAVLAVAGLAYPKTESTGGRSAERWFATGSPAT